MAQQEKSDESSDGGNETKTYTTNVVGTVSDMDGVFLEGIEVTVNGGVGDSIVITTSEIGHYIQLQPQSQSQTYTTTVSGAVVNAQGAPIVGANVAIAGSGGIDQGVTDSSGNFSLSVEHIGTIGFQVGALGYIPYSEQITTTASSVVRGVVLQPLVY